MLQLRVIYIIPMERHSSQCFFDCILRLFFYLCGVLPPTKNSELGQKADREFEISVAYIAACNLSAFVPEQYFLFFS